MFVCLFTGLVYTSVGNMAVLIFLQVLFSFLYFNVLGNEYFSRVHLFGAILNEIPKITQIIGIVPVLLGGLLITRIE